MGGARGSSSGAEKALPREGMPGESGKDPGKPAKNISFSFGVQVLKLAEESLSEA